MVVFVYSLYPPLRRPRDACHFCPLSFDLAALLPSSGTCPCSKVQRDKIGIFLPHPGPFVDLFRGGTVARLWEHVLKSAYCRVLFILSPKSGPRSDFLPNVVPFGLFLLSAIAYLKIAFYLCTSNPPKGVARSFKWFSARLAQALVSFLELVRARIRNTRGIENGIIEALAALHIPAPHTMHTESRNKSTVDIEPHPSRYDRKGPVGIGTRIT